MKLFDEQQCAPARQPARFRDQDASDPAFKRIVQPDSDAEREREKVLAWGRYANRFWPLKKS